MHEYIVEDLSDLSGEFEAVFINLELVLSTDAARLTEICIRHTYKFIDTFLENQSEQCYGSFTS